RRRRRFRRRATWSPRRRKRPWRYWGSFGCSWKDPRWGVDSGVAVDCLIYLVTSFPNSVWERPACETLFRVVSETSTPCAERSFADSAFPNRVGERGNRFYQAVDGATGARAARFFGLKKYARM